MILFLIFNFGNLLLLFYIYIYIHIYIIYILYVVTLLLPLIGNIKAWYGEIDMLLCHNSNAGTYISKVIFWDI